VPTPSQFWQTLRRRSCLLGSPQQTGQDTHSFLFGSIKISIFPSQTTQTHLPLQTGHSVVPPGIPACLPQGDLVERQPIYSRAGRPGMLPACFPRQKTASHGILRAGRTFMPTKCRAGSVAVDLLVARFIEQLAWLTLRREGRRAAGLDSGSHDQR